jgi:hypothetical protein
VWNGYGGEIEVYVKGNQLMARGLTGPYCKGIPLYRADAQDPLFFKAKTGKQFTPMLFQADEKGQGVCLDVMQYVFYRRPFQQSLRFRALAIIGALAALLITGLARKCLKKK